MSKEIDGGVIIRMLPNIFGRYQLLSDYKTSVPLKDLAARNFVGETTDKQEIPVWIVDEKKNINFIEFAKLNEGKLPGFFVIKRNINEGRSKKRYDNLVVSLPPDMRMRKCGCAAKKDGWGDLRWSTRRSKPDSFLKETTNGRVFVLTPDLKPAIDEYGYFIENVYSVKGAIIFGPDIVGMRKPELTDETVGCLIV